MMNWNDKKINKFVQEIFLYDKHNSLCLAHGRQPIIPVSIYSKLKILNNLKKYFCFEFQYSDYAFPKFQPLAKSEDLKCAITSPQEASSAVIHTGINLIMILFLTNI